MVLKPIVGRPRGGAWEAAGDESFIDEAVRRAAIGSGILLHGESGAGQEDFARRIALRLAAPASPMELTSPPHPETSRSLARLVESPPTSGPILLIPTISSFAGPELDDVARLVLHHHAVVIAADTDDVPSAAAPLGDLVGLERIWVPDMTEVATASFVENGLGGPVSSRAAHALWSGVAGNRARVRMVVEDWLEASVLVRHDEVWIIADPAPRAGPRLSRYWKGRLAAEDPAVHDVLEVLSLAGEIPLPLLLEICEPDAVDAVHGRGLLELRGSLGRDASLRGAINSEAIANHIPPGRSLQLRHRVSDCASGNGFRIPAGLVHWQVRHGFEVDHPDVLDAVEHLISRAPTKAIDLLGVVLAGADPDRAESARIEALIAAGRLTDAWECARRIRTTPKGEAAVLSPARAADLVSASWRGDYRPILKAREAPARMSDALEWLWRHSTHEALVMSGRAEEGMRAERELLRTLERSDAASPIAQRVRTGLVDMQILTGEWTRAAATLASSSSAHGVDGHGLEVVYRALARVLTADFEESVRALRCEMPQLHILDRHDVHALGSSLLAVSLAATGHRAEAFAALAGIETPHPEGAGIWHRTWGADFFSAQALGLLGRRDDAVELLMRCADRDRDLENHALELLALSGAVQWGQESALDRLESVAQRTESRFAQACTRVVHGLRTGDAESLEIGAAIARAIGQHFFADFADDRRADLNGTRTAALSSGRGGALGARSLTPRQREIVEHVLAGRSSGTIAETMGISVRTVESHLYQIYAKLDVGSRAELRAILADRTTDQVRK
ncbi:helix-turn-helix transcriptional regulator [Flaviflexus salsibiostraticola]|uniref:Helix-turn-helix transcriptional regulator n=1 Tax=Flaviflexus salsibiostraticola TaxID=1282737 RepID=A0A3S8Z6B7_9ACTO|nr:LuxR C-terminal-related transcriptional regulator [Flaviflexus salsibiostraticola]AZN29009.1 helix-turn-helix transcriptional regulator [Flaviflexus salsibiostraticola]